MLGIETKTLEDFEEETILIADELMPGETAKIDVNKVKGIVMAQGGKTSHSAIIANNLGIPSIVVPSILNEVEEGQKIILDCVNGELVINPSQEQIQVATEKLNQFEVRRSSLQRYRVLKTYTKDKQRVEVVANISTPEDLNYIKDNGAEGIGLFRSEFLYMDRDTSPSEEEQYKAYRSVFEGMNGKPVIIRTFDIGGDKQLSYYPIEKEDNPFMGYRAIRICLEDVALFKTQLRSMSSGKILEVKSLINQLDSTEMKAVSNKVSTIKTSKEIKDYLSTVVNEIEMRD